MTYSVIVYIVQMIHDKRREADRLERSSTRR